MCDDEYGYDDQFDDAAFSASMRSTTRPPRWPRSVSELRDHTVVMNESLDDRIDAGFCDYQVAARTPTRTAKNISRSQVFAEALGDGADDQYSDYRLAAPTQRDAATKITRHQEFASDAIDDGAEAGYSDYHLAKSAGAKGAKGAGAPNARNQVFTM